MEVRSLNSELEGRVAQRTAELEAANRELEAFSYSVSHDLRAPLRSIDGFCQVLLEDYEESLDDLGRQYLRRVRAASQRMAQLIDDLLGLSRLTRTSMQRQPVNLSDVAKFTAAELARNAPDRHVTFQIEEGLVVHGDPQLLRIVLENLLNNAWKFTSKHEEARIAFGASQVDGKTAFCVSDDGAGFDMAYVAKLFGPFQRLHGMTEFDGNGIGLATVQRIINRHGGTVWAEGEPEHGARFYFSL
jgi:light-regulated signal transduction histidine kinase (bacteriophytochrome)